MEQLRHLMRLLLNKVSLNRVLTEIELERLRKEIWQGAKPRRVMVAGGTRSSGSEKVLLESVEESVKVVVVNMSQTVRPDLVADLACSWPFNNGAFDAVVSTWVLEHLKDPGLFFQEAYRVLSQSGFLVVTVPFIHRKHGSPFDYWRFTDTALMHLAWTVGFGHVEVRRVGGMPFLSVVALLWPFFRVPLLGAFLALMAFLLDYALVGVARLLNKGQELVMSYPVAYVLYICK